MIESIIRFSVRNKLIIGLLTLALIAGGIYALKSLPIDAVPDITNNQVQVVTVSPSLAAQEVEQFITYPVEVAMANIPNVVEIRSVSRFGLSVVTIVFKDHVPVLEARQFVKEQISLATGEIPEGLGQPELMPITTGLGEIYQYVLRVKPGYEDRYDAMELRTIQDWIVKRQLAGTAGIVEISSFGGFLKQYEVAIDPLLLQSYNLSLAEVFEALSRNNQNSGGSYIEKQHNAYYIRTEGVVKTLDDIGNIVIANRNNVPVLIKNVGKLQFGAPKRFGAMTMDGQGEAVGGITLMLKGANSSDALANVHRRIEEVKKSLPEGIDIYPYLDRSVLVGKTIHTVQKNLLEGGIIVVFVLVLLLGDLRAGFIVASVIPLAMLFAIILMRQFDVSANLMSLGAIDFGIVVDGAVIIVEGVLHTIFTFYVGRKLTQGEMDDIITDSTAQLFRSAIYGVFIILVVFVPIMTLTGIEGKMFRPMAMTFSFAVLGALLLSLTYVPMMAALLLSKKVREHHTFADKIVNALRRMYKPSLEWALRHARIILAGALALLVGAFLLFSSMGSEFIPTLEEGDLAMQLSIQPGSSLSESVHTTTKAEKILIDNFPEVKHVVSKIGTAEVPTDPMAIEDADIMIVLKEKEEWTSATTREELVDKMKAKLEDVAGASFEFTQPIQLRFNELMTGAKTDIAIKIFGENVETLKQLADEAALLVEDIPGAGDVKVEQTEGLPQLLISFNRAKIAQYGFNIEEINALVRTAFAGEAAGVVFENERKFDLVVRLAEPYRSELDLNRLFVHLPDGRSIPLGEVAQAHYAEGPMQISREGARRRINIGVNVRGRDVAGLVGDISASLDAKLNLPPGYTIQYGGQFENLRAAQQRLSIAVPVALLLIFGLLYFTFGKLKYAVMIFSAVPLSAIGGVFALWLRDMPFSISAGVGFIALFGVAVLNGIVLISYFNKLRFEEGLEDWREIIIQGGLARLRPVVMTATVAALGFLPMALSNSNGAEVQKPLATVVIGGLITATLLTLIVLPLLYYLANAGWRKPPAAAATIAIALFWLSPTITGAQVSPIGLDAAVQNALARHPRLENGRLKVQQAQLGIDAARRLPAANLELVGGQTNTSLVDYNFTATQGLGNIAADRQRRKVAAAQTELAGRELQVSARQLKWEVSQAWLEAKYAERRRHLLEEQAALYQQLADRARLQYEAGETGGLDKAYADNQLMQVNRELATARLDEVQSLMQLQQTAWLEQTPTMPAGEMPEWPLPEEIMLSPIMLAPLQQQVVVSQQETLVQQKQFKPEFTLGYFNQSIRPDLPLQGVVAGMTLPLWRKSGRAGIQQAVVAQQIAQNEVSLAKHQYEVSTDMAKHQALVLHLELESAGKNLLGQAATLRRLADKQRSEGEIDYFRYAQSIEAAWRNDLLYLDLLRRYDLAVLAWRFWTEFE
ncbi:MAG: CusA/CzcA family heavy metal efflux RND transporter [Saprospiraceae bacterium]|nr:CusA/CzcA family heavy metal efflux RND transporter [Saprospiraceae bacterium]